MKLLGLMAVGLLAGGCVSAQHKAQELDNRNNPVFVAAWNDCVRKVTPLGWVPDSGVTLRSNMVTCMEGYGWHYEWTGPEFNASLIGLFRRVKD